MLTLLKRYQFSVAIALPSLAAFVLGIAICLRMILLQSWSVIPLGLLICGLGLYLGLRAYEQYERERKEK